MEKGHERQSNLDLLKALAIVSMVLCHPVSMFSKYHAGYEGEFWFHFGEDILGSYIVVAHGFMFAMGVGIAFSRKNTPRDLVHRGVKILILAYVLNFARYGMYSLAADMINGSAVSELTVSRILGPDILHFAGLALIATGIFRKLQIKDSFLFFIGLVLSMIGTMTALTVDTKNAALNRVVGLFIFTPDGASSFCFLCWYLFVAVGILFGKILRETPDKDAFYKKLLIGSGISAAIYLAGTFMKGYYFLSVERAYYDASPLEAAGLLSIDFFLLSVFHFLLKKVDASKFRIPIEMSRNINAIYCIHWCIIGATMFVFCDTLEISFSYLFSYVYAVAVLVVSFLLARLYKKLKAKYQENHAT